MTISIIIPVYNVEKFVFKCLNSVLKQEPNKFEKVEIIVVNDGSTDDSLTIVEEIKKEHNEIIIISQENQGLSAARNAGLSIATGDYIWFIDSDDWIAPNSLQIISKIIEEKAPEVIHFKAINAYNDKLVKRGKTFPDTTRIYSGKEIIKSRLWATCVPFYIFKLDFLKYNSLYFFNGIFHEDNEFTPRMLYYTKKVCLSNETLYFVYQNQNSITRTINPKKSFDLITVSLNLQKFVQDKVYEQKIQTCFYQFISLCINTALHGSLFMNKAKSQEFNRTLNASPKLLSCLIKSKEIKYIFEYIILKLSRNYSKNYFFLNSIKP